MVTQQATIHMQSCNDAVRQEFKATWMNLVEHTSLLRWTPWVISWGHMLMSTQIKTRQDVILVYIAGKLRDGGSHSCCNLYEPQVGNPILVWIAFPQVRFAIQRRSSASHYIFIVILSKHSNIPAKIRGSTHTLPEYRSDLSHPASQIGLPYQWAVKSEYEHLAILFTNFISSLAHPRLLVWATSKRWVPLLVATSASHWLNQL